VLEATRYHVKQALIISPAYSSTVGYKARLPQIKHRRGQWPACRVVPVFSDDVVFGSGGCISYFSSLTSLDIYSNTFIVIRACLPLLV
jgi:hypothetical protein